MYSRIIRGFSVVELVTIISVVLILASVVYVVSFESLARSNDMHRASDVSVIARSFERYYRTNAVASGPSYPPTSLSVSELAKIVGDASATTAPNVAMNSIVLAANNSAQTPTVKQYIYQPLTAAGALCSTAPCARFKLYYRTEPVSGGTVVVVDSVRQQ